jgi:prolipoprotein diacylglyceryltransferase
MWNCGADQRRSLGDGVSAPDAGPLPRHPSQLYEALTEGLVLFAVLWWLTHRRQALRTPGVIGGAFLVGYGWRDRFASSSASRTRATFSPSVHSRRHLLFPAHGSGRFLAIRAAGKRSSAPADVQS